MAKRMIIGLGLCVVDHVYLVDKLELSSDRMRFSTRLVGPGGMMGTALAQAASLGGRAHALSLLGADADGRFVRRSLKALGVKTRHLVLSPDFETTVAVVLVEGKTGERRFIVPDRRALESEAPDFDLTMIGRNTVLMVDGHFSRQALRAVKRARETGASVIGDFHRPSPGVRDLLPYVDYPIVPLEFAELFSPGGPHRAIQKLADEYGGTPVVTMGEKGGLYLEQGHIREYAARRVRVTDTTGAGDVFHGAFAVGLARGLGIVESIDLAARAASLCCTALGGTGRLMTPHDEAE